jgi:hypothetical protein
MHYKKILVLIPLCLTIGFFSCSKEEKKVEAPKQERITKKLVPPNAEAKGQNFLVELSDIEVITVVDTASKEIVETPNLKGHIKITNQSKDILDIQAATLEYLDEAGKPIAFKSGEKIAKVSSYWKAIKPEEILEGSIDATIPRAAIIEKALGKIEINLVYVPSPLNRETLTLPVKIE